MPASSRLISSVKDSNIYTPAQGNFDKGTLAYKRRVQSRFKVTEVMIDLLSETKQSGIQAKHVLFDIWFCSPSSIIAVKNIGFECITILKTTDSRLKIYMLYLRNAVVVPNAYYR